MRGTSERNFSLSQSITRITPTESDSATDKRIPARVNARHQFLIYRGAPTAATRRSFLLSSLSLSLPLFFSMRQACRNVPMYYFSSAPHRRRSRYRANCKLKTEPSNFERARRALSFSPMRPPSPPPGRPPVFRARARKHEKPCGVSYLYSQRRLLTVLGEEGEGRGERERAAAIVFQWVTRGAVVARREQTAVWQLTRLRTIETSPL